MMGASRLRHRLKGQLGQKYSYQRHLQDKQLREFIRQPPSHFREAVVATLQVGCLRMDVVLFAAKGHLRMGCDFFVKDAPDVSDWICYGSADTSCPPRENDMLLALEAVRQRNGLSYTQCCFQRLEGSTIREDKKPRVENQAG